LLVKWKTVMPSLGIETALVSALLLRPLIDIVTKGFA
jgi:hypothetical protein